ncbi:MAG TPA: TIGR03000 domain-containing protein [Gemmataceae bacterium]|jgi:uncharacterized protein (TIGR03000 family)
MPRQRIPAGFRFVLICLFLSAAPMRAQEGKQPATLHVRLPADARLVVEGQETKKTGSLRLFISPPLTPDKNYSYTFLWTFRKDGKTFAGEKKVLVRAGDDKEVDLTKESVEETKELKLPVPFVPTPQDVVERMLEAASLTDKDVLYDLGCGDGRIVVTAAKKYGCKAVGVDLDPQRVKEARANAKAKGVEKLVTIEEKDIFQVDLKPATVVTLYLLPDVNVKLVPQLEKLEKGARIFSHDFGIEDVEPATKFSMKSKDGNMHTIYVWFAPIQKKPKKK